MAATARIEPEQSITSELCARIDQLERDFRLLSVGELCRRVDAIRRIARSEGLEPVGRLAAKLGEALANGGRTATIRPYLDGMRDAVECGTHDEATARAYLASVNLRLAG